MAFVRERVTRSGIQEDVKIVVVKMSAKILVVVAQSKKERMNTFDAARRITCISASFLCPTTTTTTLLISLLPRQPLCVTFLQSQLRFNL